MIRDKHNIIPMFLAVAVHVLIFGALFVAIDLTKPAYPAVPLAITATLVSERELPRPPPPQPEPEPEDDAEQERLRLEEQKRQADLRAEQEQIRREEEQRQVQLRAEQERIRLAEETERKRRAEEEAERKRRREEEVERLRAEAERKRLEDMERQRLENERLRREAELDAEEMRLAALDADDRSRWAYAIQRAITRQFIRPASAPQGLECIVHVKQLPGGQVVDVEIGRCNGDAAVRRAIEAAVNKASPLPSPDNPSVFERDLTLIFRPEQ